MEIAQNGTIFTKIKETKGVSEEEAFEIFIQVCSAIHFLHSLHLVHRDLKPENLLFAEENKVKLCDFGWCAEIQSGERETFCGTYEYMAPEIIKEKPYNTSIDIWSLGILLYELIHGYSPFRAVKGKDDSHKEIFKNIIKCEFKIEKQISAECADLIKGFIVKSAS